MKTIKTIISVMLLCAVLSDAAFSVGPLTLIDTISVDPEGVAGAVDGCEFSKDGVYFAASDNHGVARIYLTADRSLVGKVTHKYDDHTCADRDFELNAVVWSHDGKYLVTGRNDDGVKVWKTDSFFDPADFATNDTPYKHLDDRGGNTNYETDGADFSPNNQWLATAADEYLMVYSLPDFTEIQDISAGGGSVNSVDFSYDSDFVAFGASNGNVKIVRTSDWTVIETIHSTNSVKSVRFSPDAKYLVYSGRDQRCKVYRTSDWSLVVNINHSGNEKALPCDDDDSNAAVEASAWSSDGTYLLTSGLISGELHVWDTSVWPASGSITLGSNDALAIYQAQEEDRQIEFIDVIENKVIVGGDEGNVRMYEFPPALPPDAATIVSPLDTATDVSLTADLNWNAVAQALPVAAVGEAKGNPDTMHVTLSAEATAGNAAAKHERIVRYRINRGDVFYGILIDKHIHHLTNSFVEIAQGRRDFSGARHALDKVKLLAPVNPSKIICFGWTFPSHAREVGGEERRKEPLVFLKPPTVIIAEKETIVLPQKLSSQVEFEGELAAVIGKRMRNVAPEQVMKGILGFTCMNDVTARDLTKKDPAYTRGKGFDTFGPLGPWIVTHLDPSDLRIQTIQNGQIKQNARISDMTFEIPFLISYISQVMTLLPGDVIAFGTPGGSGKLKPGDKIQVKIEKIGLLTNFVK